MSNSTLPKGFYAIAIIAIVWNLLGAMAYLGQTMIGPDEMAMLPEDQQMMILNRPAWATAAFAIAVWGGLLASILLVMKKAMSKLIFIVSFIGLAVQMIYNLFIAESTMDYGPGAIVMTLLIPLIGIFLIYYANKGQKEGWLS